MWSPSLSLPLPPSRFTVLRVLLTFLSILFSNPLLFRFLRTPNSVFFRVKSPPRLDFCSTMSNALDMSLDDLIKNNKKSGSGNIKGKGRGSSGLGPTRRQTKRSGNRPAPYSVGKAPESAWQHDMYSNRVPAYPPPATRVSSIETGSKIYISNLDYGVSTEDIKELFSEFGDLKRYSIHYDRSGRSKGTAEVVFARKADALAAVKRYNDVQLDGKPMKIEIVGTNTEKPAAINRISGVGFGNSNRVPRSVPERAGSAGRGGQRRGGRRRGKGREQVSASDLDADLEKYHAQAMQE